MSEGVVVDTYMCLYMCTSMCVCVCDYSFYCTGYLTPQCYQHPSPDFASSHSSTTLFPHDFSLCSLSYCTLCLSSTFLPRGPDVSTSSGPLKNLKKTGYHGSPYLTAVPLVRAVRGLPALYDQLTPKIFKLFFTR